MQTVPFAGRVAIIATFLCLSGSCLQAGTVVFTERTTWEAAAGSVDDISFAGLGGNLDMGYPSGLSVDGVTFMGSKVGGGNYLYVRSTPNYLYGPPDGTLCFPTGCFEAPPGSGISVMLPAEVTSVGWDFANFFAPGDYGNYYTTGLEVQFNDGTTYMNSDSSVFAGIDSPPVFVGFTSTAPITSFRILGGGHPTVRNFSFGQPTTVPEPGTFVILSTGTLGLFFLATRRRKG